jgi:hypothetical protein
MQHALECQSSALIIPGRGVTDMPICYRCNLQEEAAVPPKVNASECEEPTAVNGDKRLVAEDAICKPAAELLDDAEERQGIVTGGGLKGRLP